MAGPMSKNLVINFVLGLVCFAFLFFALSENAGQGVNANPIQVVGLLILSVVPLFLSGLGWGLIGSIVTVLTVSIVSSVILDPLFGLIYALVCGLPVVILTRQALLWREEQGQISWYPASNLMVSWTIISIALSCMALVLFYMADELRAEMIKQFDFAFDQLAKQGNVNTNVKAEELVWFVPQFFGLFWGLVFMAAGSLAQGLLVRFDKNLRPTPELSGFALPNWASIVWIAVLAVGVIGGIAKPVLGAVALILGFAFFVQGMAVIHRVSMAWTFRGPLLAVVYIIVILMIWPALVITALGLVDSWVGFRGRQLVSPNQEKD